MPPPPPLLLVMVLVLVLVLPSGWCAVEHHSAAGLHRAGLLALTPLQTIPAGPTMARRAHCLARCVRHASCASFSYGQLPDGASGCQLLGEALCATGADGAYHELQSADANYYDVYRHQTFGAQEVRNSDPRPVRPF